MPDNFVAGYLKNRFVFPDRLFCENATSADRREIIVNLSHTSDYNLAEVEPPPVYAYTTPF